MVLVTPAALLAKLTPLRPILCVVARRGSKQKNTLGLSLSDPYLAFAEPLVDQSFVSPFDVRSILEHCIEEYRVGGLVCACCLVRPTCMEHHRHERSLFIEREELLLEPLRQGFVLPVTLASDQLSYQEVIQASKDEPEQWEAVDLEDNSASTDAAVALNHFLTRHTGGWRNNTFG